MSASVSMPLGGVQVGSYDGYEQAQAAVDYLSDEKFAVENVTIIGTDLRMVERVTGRLSWGRAIAAGAAGGAWWGLFVGLLLGIFSATRGAWVGSVLAGLLIGLVFGAAFGAMGYAATRGRRDFTSTSQIVAGRYDVMCNPAHAEEARALLAAGEFPAGSMGPKIESALSFLAAGGREPIITSLPALTRALQGDAGTRITSGVPALSSGSAEADRAEEHA